MTMSEKMPIKERQNTEESIHYLRAQRYAYLCAKRIYMSRMVLSIAWPIIAVILYFTCKNDCTTTVLTGSSLILMASFFMEIYEQRFSKLGATIQEQFDTHIFNMKWNSALVGEKIKKEEIYSLAKKEKTKISELKNWYTGIDTDDEIEYVLKAQKTSTEWSIKQKRIFGNLLLILAGLIFIISTMIALWSKFLLADFIITLFFPTTSLYIYLLKGWKDFSQQVKELQRITSQIYFLLESERTSKYQLRFIQDAIYVHGRVPNNIIPNTLYYKLRNKLEEVFESINK